MMCMYSYINTTGLCKIPKNIFGKYILSELERTFPLVVCVTLIDKTVGYFSLYV